MVAFKFLNKSEKDSWLPRLFDLLYENMSGIAPSGRSYEQERAEYLFNVSPALDRAPRQIILCFVNGELAGFLQYYVRERTVMIEEVQLKKQYQRTTVFYRLCRHLMDILPEDLKYIEAYADKRNRNSLELMKKLGMVIIEEDEGPFLHLRGNARQVKKILGR